MTTKLKPTRIIDGEEFYSARDVFKDFESNLTIGEFIRDMRLCEEVTQTELAKRLGISKQALSDIEHNRKPVGVQFIKKFCNEINIEPEPLLKIYFRNLMKKTHQKMKEDMPKDIQYQKNPPKKSKVS